MVADQISKRELRDKIVPEIEMYLTSSLGFDLSWYDPIFTHAARGEWPATIVWEGDQWAHDFCEVYEGDYEIEPVNSWEISVRRWER